MKYLLSRDEIDFVIEVKFLPVMEDDKVKWSDQKEGLAFMKDTVDGITFFAPNHYDIDGSPISFAKVNLSRRMILALAVKITELESKEPVIEYYDDIPF